MCGWLWNSITLFFTSTHLQHWLYCALSVCSVFSFRLCFLPQDEKECLQPVFPGRVSDDTIAKKIQKKKKQDNILVLGLPAHHCVLFGTRICVFLGDFFWLQKKRLEECAPCYLVRFVFVESIVIAIKMSPPPNTGAAAWYSGLSCRILVAWASCALF